MNDYNVFSKNAAYGVQRARELSDRVQWAEENNDKYFADEIREQLEYCASVNRKGLRVLRGGKRD